MLVYGLLDLDLQKIIEWYPTREEGEADLALVLTDEPDWRDALEIVPLAFETSLN